MEELDCVWFRPCEEKQEEEDEEEGEVSHGRLLKDDLLAESTAILPYWSLFSDYEYIKKRQNKNYTENLSFK